MPSCAHSSVRFGVCVRALCIVPFHCVYVFQAENTLFTFPCRQQFDQKMHISKPIVGFIVCLVYKLPNEYVHSCLMTHDVYIHVCNISYRESDLYGVTVNTLNLHYAKPIQWRWIGHFFKRLFRFTCDDVGNENDIKGLDTRQPINLFYSQIESTEYTNPTAHLWTSVMIGKEI